MRLSAVEKDLNYCRVPTSSSECDSRLGILFQDKSNWKPYPEKFVKIYQKLGTLRPFYIPDVSSTLNLHGVKAISGKSGNQCHVSNIGKNIPICLPPIQSNTLGFVEADERRDHNDIGHQHGNRKHGVQFF